MGRRSRCARGRSLGRGRGGIGLWDRGGLGGRGCVGISIWFFLNGGRLDMKGYLRSVLTLGI
jgi:hypothetical protein